MNHKRNGWAIGLLLCLNAVTASASLIDRGNGLIYDQDLNITWLANANYGAGSSYDNGGSSTDGRMTWSNAVAWANNLVYGGYDDWRLPTTVPALSGYNQTGSEMGHLFYNELGGSAGGSIGSIHDTDYNLFSNIQNYVYWSGSEYAPSTNGAWYFYAGNGGQGASGKDDEWFAWAVRPGDVAAIDNPIPEPGSLALIGLGLMALRRARR